MGWASVGKWLVKAGIWAAKHPDEIKAVVDVVKPHKTAPVAAEPAPLTVEPPAVVLPAPMPPSAPTRVWLGWNADNVFAEDLNQLAADTGFSKDILATTRNQYLALMEASYRAQMAAAGRKVNGASAGVFASEDFRAFLKTGQINA